MKCLIKQSFLIGKVIHGPRMFCYGRRKVILPFSVFYFFNSVRFLHKTKTSCVRNFCGGGASWSAVRFGGGAAPGYPPRPTVAASKATPRPDTIPARLPLILPILNDVSLRHKNAGNVIWERPAYTTETKLLDFSKWKITNSPAYSLSDDMMAIIYTPATVYATPMNIYFHFYYQEIKIVAVHRVI